MAVYAIGDIQGCYDALRRLLDMLAYDSDKDLLWFAGDLVNRGPQSLATLRFVKELEDRAVCVLGNHDLHLLASVSGLRSADKEDTFDDILNAPDLHELVNWLRHQPLLHHDEQLGFTLVHAGLAPQWDLTVAKKLANEVEAKLRSEDYTILLKYQYGDQPDEWSETLSGADRYRFIINCFTRMRFCTADGKLALKLKGKPGTQPLGCVPWYEVESRKSKDEKIVFGHWSTLRFIKIKTKNIYPIDTACVWGGRLSAVQLDHPDTPIFHVDCPAWKTYQPVGN